MDAETAIRPIKPKSPFDVLLPASSVFLCTFFIYKDFGIRMIIGYAFLGLALLFTVVQKALTKKSFNWYSPEKTAYFFFAAVILVLFFIPGTRRDEDTLSFVIAMLISALFLFFVEPEVRGTKAASYIIIAASTAITIYIIVFTVFPDAYSEHILPLLSQEAQKRYTAGIKIGYGLVMGGNYYFEDYIMALGAFLGLGSLIAGNRKFKISVFCLIIIAAVITATVLVGRRGELLALVLSLAGVAVFTYKPKFTKKTVIVAVICVAIIVAAAAYIIPRATEIPYLQRYVQTFEDILTGDDVSTGRLILWQRAFSLFKENKMSGIGWGNFAYNIPEGFVATHSNVQNVHNTYLQFLCENGIVGTVLLLLPVFYILVLTLRQTFIFKASNTYKENKIAVALNAASLGIQLYLFTLNVFDPCFYKLVFWNIYLFAVVLYAAARNIEGKKYDTRFSDFTEHIISTLRVKLKKQTNTQSKAV